MIMAWKSIYQGRSRYRDMDRRVSGDQGTLNLPGWVKQAIVACFILSVLFGASQASSGLARRIVSFAKSAVEDDLAFDDVKGWVAGLPQRLRSLATLDIRNFWSKPASGKPTELAWPVSGQVTSFFGWRPNQDSGGLSLHQGIDIEAPVGTKVVSVLDGVVVSVRQSPTYGLVVEVEHGGGFSTVYGHLDTALVEVDQTVKRGEAIATVGESGNATGPHLHFEIRKDGLEVDPMLHLPPLVKGP